jgi:hypothetical protein
MCRACSKPNVPCQAPGYSSLPWTRRFPYFRHGSASTHRAMRRRSLLSWSSPLFLVSERRALSPQPQLRLPALQPLSAQPQRSSGCQEVLPCHSPDRLVADSESSSQFAEGAVVDCATNDRLCSDEGLRARAVIRFAPGRPGRVSVRCCRNDHGALKAVTHVRIRCPSNPRSPP